MEKSLTKRPQFTVEAHTADGRFQTGDRGPLDPEGYLAITGRTKDLIIRRGENIAVVEVENLLCTHAKIAGVAIVAVPDPRLGERARAVVIPRAGPTITVFSEFPMTPSGTIQKFKLRELIAERARPR